MRDTRRERQVFRGKLNFTISSFQHNETDSHRNIWALTPYREAITELQSLKKMYEKSRIPIQYSAAVQSCYSSTTEKLQKIKTSQSNHWGQRWCTSSPIHYQSSGAEMAERQNRPSILKFKSCCCAYTCFRRHCVCQRLCLLKALCAGKEYRGMGCILSMLKILPFFYSKEERGERYSKS